MEIPAALLMDLLPTTRIVNVEMPTALNPAVSTAGPPETSVPNIEFQYVRLLMDPQQMPTIASVETLTAPCPMVATASPPPITVAKPVLPEPIAGTQHVSVVLLENTRKKLI